MGNPVWPAAKVRARAGGAAVSGASDGEKYASGASASSKSYKGGVVAGMEAAGRGGDGGEGAQVGLEGQEEAAYRLHVVRRLPGLLTLDCTDVSEEERATARKVRPLCFSVGMLLLLLLLSSLLLLWWWWPCHLPALVAKASFCSVSYIWCRLISALRGWCPCFTCVARTVVFLLLYRT